MWRTVLLDVAAVMDRGTTVAVYVWRSILAAYSGGGAQRLVARWRGAPVLGVPEDEQLCVARPPLWGRDVSCLSRGTTLVAGGTVARFDAGTAHVLDASLTAHMEGADRGADVTEFTYTLDADMGVTPLELAALIFGHGYGHVTEAATVDVVLMDGRSFHFTGRAVIDFPGPHA